MRVQLEVHASINGRTMIDRWYTDEDYSTNRGADGLSCVVRLSNGCDRKGRAATDISYGQCWRIIVSEAPNGPAA